MTLLTGSPPEMTGYVFGRINVLCQCLLWILNHSHSRERQREREHHVFRVFLFLFFRTGCSVVVAAVVAARPDLFVDIVMV